jgi:hypothetical protein
VKVVGISGGTGGREGGSTTPLCLRLFEEEEPEELEAAGFDGSCRAVAAVK